MAEDQELMDFLRERLEGDIHAEPPRFEEIMRAAAVGSARSNFWRARLWATALLAASLAAICSFAVVNLHVKEASQERAIANVIDILCISDGIEAAPGESSVADMLLAWEDMSYESAVSELGTDAVTYL